MEALSQADIIAGRFEILGPSGAGNMGEVLKARDLESEAGETVAVKLIRRRRSGEEVSLTEADKNAARFEREVRIMKRLSSLNLPRTIAGGLDGDRPYLAMEFIDGVTLSALLDENGQLPVAWAAAIGAQIARGLDVAHRAGVVHRDVKPSNIMLATRRARQGAGLRRRPDPRRHRRRTEADQHGRNGGHRPVHGAGTGHAAGYGHRRGRPVRARAACCTRCSSARRRSTATPRSRS